MPGIRTFTDPELCYNRIVPLAKFERTELLPYSFGPTEYREAVLMFNAKTVIPEDQAVDYII